MREEVLRMERVTYREQGVTQLENFSMTVLAGEIMGLVPVNYYGLPALIKLLGQNMPLHYGYIYYHEKLINQWNDRAHGFNRISIIQNKSCLAEGLTVADNIFVLRAGFRKWLMQPDVLKKQLEPFLRDIGMDIPADAYVGTLSLFERFVVELLKAVVAGNRLIVLNGISNFISDAELRKIHEILKHYARKGISFLYIASHFEETRQICDRTALMMNGQIIKCFLPSERDFENQFLGCTEQFEQKVREWKERDDQTLSGREGCPPAVFQAVDLCCGEGGALNFSVARGECLVLQDLDNCIIQDFVKVLSGEKRAAGGSFFINGSKPDRHMERRLAVVQELAAQAMLFPNMSYLDNLCFTLDKRFPDVWRRKRIKRSIRQEYAQSLGKEVFDLPVDRLSERQKYELVYTRILLQNPEVVFCIQPFKGAEVSVRIRIWELLEQLLNKGIAVVILAVNLADALALADRLIRLHRDKRAEEYQKEDFARLPVTTPWLYLYQQQQSGKGQSEEKGPDL